MTSYFGSLAAECLPTLPVTQPQAVVTIAVPVVVLVRVYPIYPKDVLWGSNPAIWMAKEVPECCNSCSIDRQFTLAVCGLALSCWNNRPLFSIMGTTWCCRISSLYRWAVTVLLTFTNLALPVSDIAPHIITLPPPNLSASWMLLAAKRLFRLL
jgi:hypothetical protein